MRDAAITRARDEGLKAAATGGQFDTFYLGRHVSRAQREAYQTAFHAGRRRS